MVSNHIYQQVYRNAPSANCPLIVYVYRVDHQMHPMVAIVSFEVISMVLSDESL